MKKLFILIAFFAIPSIVFSQARPLMHDMRLNEMKAMTRTSSSLDHISLVKKGTVTFLAHRDSGEVYTPLISHGQGYEAGGINNYNITYDPYSKYVFGISTGRYALENTNDSINKIGRLMYFKYQKNQYGYTQSNMFMRDLYDVTEAVGTITGSIRHEWQTPTVVVGSTTQTSNSEISDVSVVVSAQMDEYEVTATTSKPMYNTFWWINGDRLHDEASYKQAVTTFDVSEPYVNPIAGYAFNEHLKGHTAYFDGIPYALFFGPLHHGTGLRVNPIRFGFLASRLDNISDVGDITDANITSFQILPKRIDDIFGQVMVPSDTSNMRWFNLDNDNNGNLYFGFMETNANNQADEFYTDFVKEYTLRLPVVVKTPFNTEAGLYDDIIADEAVVDTMPVSVFRDYVLDNGGLFNTEKDGEYPWLWLPYIGSPRTTLDLPFVVTSEDNYHFITPIYLFINANEAAIHLVEMTKTGGNWKINKIADIESYVQATYDTSYAFTKADASYFMNDAPHPTLNPDGDSLQVFFWNYGAGANGFTDYPQGLQPQIAKTADGQYLIAKYQLCGAKDYVKMPNGGSMKFRLADSIEIDTDTLWSPSLWLSYRHVHPDSTWSTPVRASHMNFHENPQDFDNTKDTIQPWATYMPRIVPSVDEVIVSYSYFSIQDSAQRAMPIEQAKRRYYTYRYTGIIVPSAKTGPNEDIPVGIEEGVPALTNDLDAVYPNPASNTASFKFKLLKPNHVKLTITNMLGQEVAVLADQYCNASEYTINEYDVSILPIGTYYLTLTSGSVVKTKMFTIAR